MIRSRFVCRGLPLLFTGMMLAGASGQEKAAPSSAPAASGPVERVGVTAKVIEVRGDAQWSPLDPIEWKPVKTGDEFPEMTQIRTGLRASVKLQIGKEEPYSAMVVESVSKVVLSEAYKTTDTKRVRVGVGYGKIRAGVAEGGLKSDFTVDSPVATLSKRGTWNFGLFYERDTNRFEVFLLDRGLVDALDKQTGERRTVQSGEFVTQAMRRWFDQAQYQRNIPVSDILGQGDIEVAFNQLGDSGLGILNPDGAQNVLIGLNTARAQQVFASQARQNLTPLPGNNGGGTPSGPLTRIEGFFGTGRGNELIPIVIDANAGFGGSTRSGKYLFRRSALEGWLSRNRR